MKIFVSKGLSSRPLNLFEKAVEVYRDVRYTRRRGLVAQLRWLLWRYSPAGIRDHRIVQRLIEALNSNLTLRPGVPLKVESLEITMRCVTFDARTVRQRRTFRRPESRR